MGTLLVVLAILAFIVIGSIGWIAGIYNNLVAVKNNVDKAWANIDVIMKQRHDELPKLIDTCKGYMTHERSIFENLSNARARMINAPNDDAKAQAANDISSGLKTVFALAENYPDLKANQNFLDLQNRISVLEEQIADRREFFNESVNVYNIRIKSFPDLFVAGFMGCAPRTLLQIPSEETADVKVQF